MTDEITFDFACRDDCLDQMVPSDLRQLVAERDRLRAELAERDGQNPVAWQFYQGGKWHNGNDSIADHRKNTEAAGIPIRDLYADAPPSPHPAAPEGRRWFAVQSPTGMTMALTRDGKIASELQSDCGDGYTIMELIEIAAHTPPAGGEAPTLMHDREAREYYDNTAFRQRVGVDDLVDQFRAQSPEHDRLYREERARVDAAEALAALDEMLITQDEEQRAEAYNEVRQYLKQAERPPRRRNNEK